MLSKETVKEFLLFLGILLLLFGAGFLSGRRNALRNIPEPQKDTVTIRDTITDYKPQETSIPDGFKLIPVSQIEDYEKALAEFRDSLSAKPKIVTYHDTSYIAVPISKYHFTDKKTYECEATGYDVKMLWHKSFQETKYITDTYPIPPKFALSPFVGGRLYLPGTFYLGAGIRADFWSGRWQFSPSVGYGMTFADKSFQHGFSAEFTASYNLILR